MVNLRKQVNMPKRNGFLRAHGGSASVKTSPTTSRRQALMEYPPCVYAARLQDGTIKIGWTTRLYDRLTEIGNSVELLAAVPGTWDDEQAIHYRLTGHAVHGVEWYAETAEVVAVVNELRSTIGLPEIARPRR